MDKEVKEKKGCKQQVVFCVLVVLYVFVSLLFSLPVHAEESLQTQQIFKYSNIVEGSYTQTVTYFVNESCDSYNFILGDPTVSWKGGVAVVEPSSSFAVSSSWVTTYDDGRVGDPWNTVNTYESYTLSNGLKINWYAISPSNGAKYDIDGHYYLFNSGFDFSTKDGVKSFLEHYFVVKDIKADEEIGGGSIDNPDFQDTAYAFTGFTANSKMKATWTGTTERSYLKDEDVVEYVRVSYGFAAKDAPDSIKQVDNDSKEYSTAAKSLTVKVSDLVPDDDSWFLRYVQVIPCYRQAGLGVWGDFYHGESSYVYFNADGSIDKIVAPYVKGSLSADMERPVIVLHEAANGNPTESDYSYFEFNNAREDYFFEMKGRWYTTNDFDIYRDKLVWKYKYSTLLKNDLSTWVTVADGKNSVGKFQFDILGKSSWENLITSYPVDDRNYIGGSYALVNKITGYSDAVDTLKMLLKQPYSLYNGYEVYVRYYRYDENGSIEYSKWTHFYNNLANSEGSSGSRLDDLDNMYSENQSDKGLTDDELSDLENTGNSRNDLDAVPKNNYDYSSLETATMNFFDLLTNYGSMLGQFPSMVTAVFGFLPVWLIGLIAVAIGAVIVCRFIGR
ncbi:MAG TPA: hypothetical protein DHW13_11460 [Lachnospiraceae bacterium]|nr:hypothetical protein [Lachnospiraceae bacterium]HCK48874.1 hypothetical protein [Lachnospiraceae bacterium]